MGDLAKYSLLSSLGTVLLGGGIGIGTVLPPSEQEVFESTYKYLIPRHLGDEEQAYKCKQSGGKYVFAPGNNTLCVFE